MAVDTKSMRDIIDAAPGDRIARDKHHLHALIDAALGNHVAVEENQIRSLLGAVDLGRVADQLAGMSAQVRSLATAEWPCGFHRSARQHRGATNEEEFSMAERAIGALIGWRREETKHGIALTLQLAPSEAEATGTAAHRVTLIMNDRQLRSLARDLARAAVSRGMTLVPKKPWWAFWREAGNVA